MGRFGLGLLLILVFSGAIAQEGAKLSVSRNRILLGEQFELTLSATVPVERRIVVMPAIPETLNHLEVIRRSGVDSVRAGDKFIYSQVITMTGFDSGRWVIPPQAFLLNGKRVMSDSIGVEVLPIELRGNDYNDIKDIIEVEEQGISWQKWLLALAGAALIVALVYYFLTKKKAAPVAVSPALRSSAYEEALEAMKKIRQEKANERGEMKQYYSRLYDTFRVYLSRVSGRSFMEQTTDGLLLGTRERLNGSVFSQLAEVLRITDAVKFARYPSSIEESAEAWERIRQGIEEINRQKR